MKLAYRRAAIAGGLTAAVLAAIVVGFAVIGVASGMYGWAMYGEGGTAGMGSESKLAAMEAELAVVEAERNAMLREIGVRPPGLEADVAAEVRSRAAPILEGYVAAYAGGAIPDAATISSLNAEYDALLSEYGAAPQELNAEQARAITEIRAAESLMLDRINDRYTTPEIAGLGAEDAEMLGQMGVGVGKAATGAGLANPEMGAEQELTLATRLAPLEQRYIEIHGELETSRNVDALQAELLALDGQSMAIIAAAGGLLPIAPSSAASPGSG